MAVRRLAQQQPESFAFSPENLEWAKRQITKYPPGRQASAVIPLLWRAQEQHEGWLPEPAMRYIADMLEMPYIRVLEVATFYTMFQLAPVGKKAHVQVCGTTPCMLRGAGDLIDACKKRIAPHQHELSADGAFSWEEVECLGACVNAPMVQVFSDTYEDLTEDSFNALLDTFERGGKPKPGPQIDRLYSAPEGGFTSLTDPRLDQGSSSEREAAEGVETGNGHHVEPTSEEASAEVAGHPDPTGLPEEAATRAQPTGEPKQEPATAEAPEASAKATHEHAVAQPEDVAEGEAKPAALDSPRNGKPDDLKRISGIGAKIEKTLNENGIYHFDQIAGWSDENVAWLDNNLKLRGRIGREEWVHQAQALQSADAEGKGE
ncbi:NADH-quinone oxidoreductase subunit NuoE [Lutibaculum baratangense]|uniref:NADH-ubiquinone oxidoreductase chain E n=1 Tax=Lutibaculum baratangense AMV1 TaxID=631454 RepID=V4RG43_9HYPH|nr:NADH-quinone oxidoreductase subunit NuoE [Lutibaculum baratangense]ESR25116.1 NADH-ubiquinone oxidoreductase chain E [Lutibaculum baratangense AMV1]